MKYHIFQKIKSQKPGRPTCFMLGVTTMFSEGLLNFLGSVNFNRGRQELLPKPVLTTAISILFETCSVPVLARTYR